jgi:peptidylprolyl isomerase
MSKAKDGDTVKVHYKGTLEDGTVFDTTAGRDPIEFKIGGGEILPGFEQAVVGMASGEKRHAEIAAKDAYGPHQPDRVIEVGRDKFPDEIQPEVGQRLQMVRDGGEALPVTVVEVGEESVTLDANHPLAGKDVTFEIELVEIV